MSDRQPGQTTRQMQEAPQGAVFLWPVGRSTDYAKALARHLSRTDLRIIGPSDIENLRGTTAPALIIDHACWVHLSNREWDDAREMQMRMEQTRMEQRSRDRR
jgi:hypothetical protein